MFYSILAVLLLKYACTSFALSSGVSKLGTMRLSKSGLPKVRPATGLEMFKFLLMHAIFSQKDFFSV